MTCNLFCGDYILLNWCNLFRIWTVSIFYIGCCDMHFETWMEVLSFGSELTQLFANGVSFIANVCRLFICPLAIVEEIGNLILLTLHSKVSRFHLLL